MPYKDPKKQAASRRRTAAKAKAADPAGFAARQAQACRQWANSSRGLAWRKRHQKSEKFKVYQREWHLKSTYGLSQAGYSALLAAQGMCCAICFTDDPGAKGFHVDHDHATGRVRGLLCSKCNMGLGSFLDDVARLRSAIAYLELT